jgi:rod shape-determining protein MreC
MFVDHHQQHLQGLRKAISTFITPIIVIADIPGDFFAWGGEKVMSRSQLSRDNRQLKDEVLILKAQLQKYVAMQTENARLRNLLGTENKQLEKRLVAEIISIDADPFRLKFMINKGSRDDVYLGQAVIDANGVVGQVVEVALAYSRVLMISDSTHAIPVRNNRNGIRATAVGTGEINQLALQFVPDTTDIKVGDLLLSSGLGQRFPDGYRVAKVTSVTRSPGEPFAQIIAEVEANLEQSAPVLLVWADNHPQAKHVDGATDAD